jgi:hypothetical protein
MCAKHIVASGIEKVIFLEPYPKSLVATLHLDSIQIEGGDRGKYQSFPTVQFEHFFGITPRRYREIFERRKRKDVDGNFESYIGGSPRPFMDIRLPLYPQLEDEVLKSVEERLQNVESHKFFEEDA